ncbi:hypothetical protein B9G98_00798 [Wickerhamiella sorbophila]|uniref:Uncharacterized protein n=1 Tax=Wickerhamiella sorbophila TaxID=45607 RepID=A0A2T0FDT9_9ASCO|nr:hypothetical protein B9G98_00798 [Wickerhamiella sorbophila]PRT53178.1 hypothetical protein B9G98_00798 [Wickerhamiella sorbophila]
MTDTPGDQTEFEVEDIAVPALRQVTLEDVDEAEVENAGVEAEPEVVADDQEEVDSDGFEEDDFGDFDDYEEFDEPEASPAAPEASEPEVSSIPLPLSSYKDVANPGDRLKEFFKVQQKFVYGTKDHLTPTSQMLWEQLMANPQAMLIEWSKSAVHRRLAVALGAPLDLDQSLPKAETRQMVLPDKNKTSGLPDSSRLPHWRLLTLVSEQAVQGMSDEELNEHINTLKATVEAAELLQQEFESVEMGLNGEKEVLEGMVESLLVYAQKSQRTKLQKRH